MVGPADDAFEREAHAAASAVVQRLSNTTTAAAAPTVRRSAGGSPPVIRRLQVIDTETGEELKPLTLQDMVDRLPTRVRRALNRLPRATLDALARLPREAQTGLLNLAEQTQLAIIAALQGGGGNRRALPGPRAGGGAMVAAGGAATAAPGGGLPPELVDFLLGRGGQPDWLNAMVLNMAAPTGPGGPLLLEGPAPGLGDPGNRLRRPVPDAHQRRQMYGNHLATNRPRPRPSGVPVAASPDVAGVAAGHKAKADERAERERDKQWSAAESKAHGTRARQARSDQHDADVSSAAEELSQQQKNWKPTGSRKQQRNAQKPATLVNAEAEVERLKTAPDLDAVEQRATSQRAADLALLRNAKLTRAAIDALILALGDGEVHRLLDANGPEAIARLASRLSPAQVDEVLQACDGRVPGTLTDPVADALPGLLAAGVSPRLVLAALRELAGQFSLVLAEQVPTCVRLIQLPSLKRLKSMCQGGQLGQVVQLMPHMSNQLIGTLLDLVDTPAELATLCGAGPVPLISLLQCGVAAPKLRTWCRAPIHVSTAQLLARPNFATVVPILQILSVNNCGPVELLAALVAGANAAQLCLAVNGAATVLKTPADALQYFVAHPADGNVEFRADAAQAVANQASLRPTNRGTKYTPNGAPYTDWGHNATITCPQIHMLLNEGSARIVYSDTFETKTEQSNGGGTEEYKIEIHDGNKWSCRWVVHLHRKKGDSKASVPVAMHIKRWEQRKLKDATRLAMDSSLAARCRVHHP